jgi:anti-sigma regulatory factor (Ser/Thr protein kinase)
MDDGLIWLRLPADMTSLARFTEFAHEGARAAGLPEAALGKLELILEEVLVNVFRYAGCADAAVGYAVEPSSCLRVDVRDSGPEFNPLEQQAPDLDASLEDRPIGGLGIFLVQTMAETVSYRRECGQNILSFQVR